MKIASIETAFKTYCENITLNRKDVEKLFGCCSTKAREFINEVNEEITKQGDMPISNREVPTDVAFKVWGLSIKDIQKRYRMLSEV